MCHSDLHKTTDEWKNMTSYPMVPGHEIVGVVVALGPKATVHKLGDRVGCGPQRLCCVDCKAGADNVCSKGEGMYDPKFGGVRASSRPSPTLTPGDLNVPQPTWLSPLGLWLAPLAHSTPPR